MNLGQTTPAQSGAQSLSAHQALDAMQATIHTVNQASSPGMCWALAESIRGDAPSAMRTRMAAKQAVSRPLVPLRQLDTFCGCRP